MIQVRLLSFRSMWVNQLDGSALRVETRRLSTTCLKRALPAANDIPLAVFRHRSTEPLLLSLSTIARCDLVFGMICLQGPLRSLVALTRRKRCLLLELKSLPFLIHLLLLCNEHRELKQNRILAFVRPKVDRRYVD
jgi:hypothetical protein